MQERWTLFLARIPGGKLLTGGAILFASMTIVNAGNYAFNLILGRWLGPAAFSDLSLIVTLMLVVSFMTTSLAQTSAKFAAIHTADNDLVRLSQLRRWLGRVAWIIGGILALLLVLGAPLWRQFFHTTSAWPFIILGVGLPVFFAQGVDRGVLQGQTRFGILALSYQAEMWVRLLGAVGLVALGLAVNGAVTGITLSFIATWLVARQVGAELPSTGVLPQSERQMVARFSVPVAGALIGQVLINNSDILIVKHFFEPGAAGQYAALALIGRIVFFATWSIVTVMFPIVAQRHRKGEAHRHLLFVSIGIVAGVSAVITAGTLSIPELIVQVLFGSAYLDIAPLLWLYALATMLYALGNVVINYRLSAGHGGGSLVAVVAGLVQVGGLWLFHDSLRQVVLVQIYIMAFLFGTVLAWDIRLYVKEKRTQTRNVST